MVGGIEKFDDHPVFYDCMWNPDLLAAAVRQTTSQSCLSISRWAIQKNPRVTIDGGPQKVEPGWFVGDTIQRSFEFVAGNGLEITCLGLNAQNIVHQWNGCGSRIGTCLLVALCSFLSVFCQAIVEVIQGRRASMYDQLTYTQLSKLLFHDSKGETYTVGHSASSDGSNRLKGLKDQRLDYHLREAAFLERFRFIGPKRIFVQGCGQCIAGHC